MTHDEIVEEAAKAIAAVNWKSAGEWENVPAPAKEVCLRSARAALAVAGLVCREEGERASQPAKVSLFHAGRQVACRLLADRFAPPTPEPPP